MSVKYDLSVGFSRLDVTPPLGINLRGYFHQRLCEGILDALEVNAVALKKDNSTVVMITLDAEACSTQL